MTVLLDANVLIALVVADHVHHDAAEEWFTKSDEAFATCPITQGSLVRLLVREGHNADDARSVVTSLSADEQHEFIPDSVPYGDVDLGGVLGHRQVTDAYLAHLARTHEMRLVTFDHGLVQQHSDVAELVPTIPEQSR